MKLFSKTSREGESDQPGSPLVNMMRRFPDQIVALDKLWQASSNTGETNPILATEECSTESMSLDKMNTRNRKSTTNTMSLTKYLIIHETGGKYISILPISYYNFVK